MIPFDQAAQPLFSTARQAGVQVGQDQAWWDQPLIQVVGPDTARQRVTEVDGLFAVFDLEVTSSPTVSPRFRELWKKHHQTWKDFKKSVDEMGTVSMFLQALSVNERAGHFARGLKEWRDAFAREGGKPTAPAPNERPKETTSTFPWSTLAIILACAGGIVAIGYTARSFHSSPESSAT